jgi:2-alkyl-3-oxoalkanoate reductase
MRVLLIGSTGVIGREAVPRLLEAGHTVTGLARTDERAKAVATLGIEPVVGDLFDVESMSKAVQGQEAVLNLATRIPTSMSAIMRGMKDNDRVRAVGSRTLVDAALSSGDVRIIVQEGISFIYADGGESILDENAPLAPAKNLMSALEAHRNIERFAEDSGRVGVRLRIGAIIGDEPMARMLVKMAKLRMPVVPGSPASWFTAIHPSDVGAAAVAALGAPSGVYNVGATPLRKSEVAKIIAEVAGVSKVRSIPNGLLVGQFKVLGRSHRVDSGKLSEATGWRPARSTLSAEWFPQSGT